MTKSESKEANHALCLYAAGLAQADYCARIISMLIRSSRGKNTKNELITMAASFPAIVQHPEFII